MKVATIQDRPDLDTLTAVIARSPIIVAQSAGRDLRLPAGFDGVDIAILDWIAVEGRRIGRSYLRM